MKSLLTFTNVLLPLLLGGCAMGSSRPNTSEDEFKLDRFQSEQQATTIYPVVIASFGSGHWGTFPKRLLVVCRQHELHRNTGHLYSASSS
jgi:hypothetical protein